MSGGELPSLSLEEQIVLLQQFAYHLVKNHKQVVSREDASRFIGNAMRGFRSKPADPEPAMQAGRLLEAAARLLPAVEVRVNGRLAVPEQAQDAVL